MRAPRVFPGARPVGPRREPPDWEPLLGVLRRSVDAFRQLEKAAGPASCVNENLDANSPGPPSGAAGSASDAAGHAAVGAGGAVGGAAEAAAAAG
eukprot:9249756-Pyramimonas_sp.AAC.1